MRRPSAQLCRGTCGTRRGSGWELRTHPLAPFPRMTARIRNKQKEPRELPRRLPLEKLLDPGMLQTRRSRRKESLAIESMVRTVGVRFDAGWAPLQGGPERRTGRGSRRHATSLAHPCRGAPGRLPFLALFSYRGGLRRSHRRAKYYLETTALWRGNRVSARESSVAKLPAPRRESLQRRIYALKPLPRERGALRDVGDVVW